MSDNHGNTPAAWTAVIVGLVGFLVGSIGLMMSPVNLVIFWIGLILLPIAAVVFVVMTKMGLGDAH
ncbi:hypothetical protein ncot_07095 [Nocardioides sp. JQ2195]|uniref:HGxxPAAW family protein n=1 Tax=Nocardioides sp. JQ2195 TaxID=2592334 RepID=UPI00143EC631|nr:HGxxPAAW family protein [Nocardioides sp. JQ2195]QIX26391.1 hypothetical protein ncot_07095 [Nocardioides sp. JQ2195]